MVSTLTLVLTIASLSLWLAVGYALVSAWRRRPSGDAAYDLDPEDGCGCVEMWEHLSNRRRDSN